MTTYNDNTSVTIVKQPNVTLGVAERVGFEPTVAKGYTRSPGAPDRPLQHLSKSHLNGGEGGIRTHAPL